MIRAAVEKQPLTLEKDKKDQSKYCLSSPKPPVLKWANCDINVVEWANISKFSTLYHIVTPLRLLELFLDDVLVDVIFGHTKSNSHSEKSNNSKKFNKKNSLILKNGTASWVP